MKNKSKLFFFTLIIIPIVFFSACQNPQADYDQQGNVFHSIKADKDTAPTADITSDFWKDIKPITIDKDIRDIPMPDVKNHARSRWTNDYLYFLISGPYDQLFLKPDPDTENETYRLWDWEVFEVYIGADFENINLYREFQVSAQDEFLDLNIDCTVQRPGLSDERYWDSGFTVKSKLDTENKIWYAEMRIPIKAIDERKPIAGNEMRINVQRLNNKRNPKLFMAWQPTGLWNPHVPEKFGTLKLVD